MSMIELWVIMDKDKKAIACGSPRNRSMRTVESLKDNPMRILMYGTEKRAMAAFSGGLGFYDETDGYLAKTYPGMYPGQKWFHGDYDKVCIPVKVRLEFGDSCE